MQEKKHLTHLNDPLGYARIALGQPLESKAEYIRRIFSERLFALMQGSDLNQKELGKIIGVEQSTVGRWLKMKAWPEAANLAALSDYFKVSHLFFLDDGQPIKLPDPSPKKAIEVLQKFVNDNWEKPAQIRRLHNLDKIEEIDIKDLQKQIDRLIEDRESFPAKPVPKPSKEKDKL